MGLVFFLEGVFHGNVQDFRTKASMATVEKGADVEKRTDRFSKGEPYSKAHVYRLYLHYVMQYSVWKPRRR